MSALCFFLLSYMAYHFRLLNPFHVGKINKVQIILHIIYNRIGHLLSDGEKKYLSGRKVTVQQCLEKNGIPCTTLVSVVQNWLKSILSCVQQLSEHALSMVRYPTSLYLALEGEREPWLGCWARCPRWGRVSFWTLLYTWVVSLDQHGRSCHPILQKKRRSYFFY